MCISPSHVWAAKANGFEKVPVPCKLCWRCRENRINDFVGRGLAEAAYSDWVITVTLTYRNRDDLKDRVVHKEHFQNFIRSMRARNQFKIRYFVAGEIGDRGKAHFHCTLFGVGRKPNWPHKVRHWIDQRPKAGERSQGYWPHGHIFADLDGDYRSIRYAMKYLGKDDVWISQSRRPPLGAVFFSELADRTISLGVLPSGFEYRPPGGARNHSYLMGGATRRDYLLKVVQGWRERRPLDLKRLNEWVLKSLEKAQKWAFERFCEAWRRDNMEIYLADAHKAMAEELDQRRPDGRKIVRDFLEVDHWEVIHGQEADQWLNDALAAWLQEKPEEKMQRLSREG